MTCNHHIRCRHQLLAAGIAFCVSGLMAASGPYFLERIKLRSKVNLVASPSAQKDQGEILQRDAFSDDRVLPVYGSSELTKETRNRAEDFFKKAPTGFRICPVGRPGNTSLLIAEKLAALGPVIRGRKLAVFLSSTWFLHGASVAGYSANFSRLQAMGAVLDGNLTLELRGRLARRMLDFPGTIKSESMLEDCMRDVAAGKDLEGRSGAQTLLLRWEHALLTGEDGWNTVLTAIRLGRDGRDTLAKPKVIDWASLCKHESQEERPDESTANPAAPVDAAAREAGSRIFLQRMEASIEWKDLDILLDVLVDLRARPLILGIPLPPKLPPNLYPEAKNGLNRNAREYYYQRLEEACARRGLPLVDWREHDGDETFLMATSAHFTRLGWLYVDRALDDFYHDRLQAKSGN